MKGLLDEEEPGEQAVECGVPAEALPEGGERGSGSKTFVPIEGGVVFRGTGAFEDRVISRRRGRSWFGSP